MVFSTSRRHYGSDFEQSNTGHEYFIGVIETVLNILGRGAEPGKNPAAIKTDLNVDDPLVQMVNIFETLEIEPDTEHTMTEPKEGLDDSGPKVVYEEEPSAEETIWLIYCFFQDLNIVRDHLKDLWTSYKCGDADLAAVAL